MGEKVSHIRVLSAILSTPTLKMAAKKCGIAEKTLHRWLKAPELQEALRLLRDEMAGEAMRQTLQAVGEAISTLQEIMKDPNAAPMPRVVAAKALLDGALRVCGVRDLARRLDAMGARDVPLIIDDIPPWE